MKPPSSSMLVCSMPPPASVCAGRWSKPSPLPVAEPDDGEAFAEPLRRILLPFHAPVRAKWGALIETVLITHRMLMAESASEMKRLVEYVLITYEAARALRASGRDTKKLKGGLPPQRPFYPDLPDPGEAFRHAIESVYGSELGRTTVKDMVEALVKVHEKQRYLSTSWLDLVVERVVATQERQALLERPCPPLERLKALVAKLGPLPPLEDLDDETLEAIFPSDASEGAAAAPSAR